MSTGEFMLLIIGISYRTIICYTNSISTVYFCSIGSFLPYPTLEFAFIDEYVVNPVKPLFESDAPMNGIVPLSKHGGFLL